MDKNSKIYVAGHRGLVGSAIWNNLLQRGYTNLVGRTHKELDLTDQQAVRQFFDEERPDAVVLAAAFVGGIMANSLYRADFIMMNMKMQCNVISEAYAHGVKKLLFLGSTCIYPKNAPQPMKEDCLLTSELEYTNEEYAIAKIAGLKMCESYNLQYGTNYIAVMPTNLYGPNDNFHLENSHVMPAMMRKVYLAKLIHDGEWDMIRKDLSNRPVGANIKEALRAQTTADFRAKMNIALKEASETEYWLELLHESDYIDDLSFDSIINDNIELIKILTSIVKNTVCNK